MNAAPPRLTVRALQATAVEVPMTYALGTSRQRITAAPLLLLDLLTEEGITGRAAGRDASTRSCRQGAGQ